MATVIAKSVLNVLLNWMFIFGHWGSPELGVAGSALGTALSTIIFDLVLVGVLFTAKYRETFHLRWRAILKPKAALFGQVLKLGVPVGFEFMLWTGGQAVLIAMVNRVDAVSSGWFGVLNTLMVLSIQVYNGIGVATLVLIGRASGAGDKKEVRYLSAYGMASAMAACVIVGAVFVIWPHAVLSLFLTDPAARTELIPLLWLSALIMFFKALNIIAGNSLRGTGDTLWMMYTQAGGTVIIIAVAAWLVFGLHWGIAALMIAVLVDEMCRGVVNEAKFLSK
jgi:Na+-driven multidrug efflux pump